jgi:glutamate N-acetyltransferase/amino-acid N-acetyltransferase
MEVIEGGICALDNVMASGVRREDYGVALILSRGCQASAVFTSNKVVAAPIAITQRIISKGKISAIIANSGNANCFTGKEGIKDGEEMCRKVANKLGLNMEEVAVASTGVIGKKLKMTIINHLIEEAIQKLENSPKASKDAAKAIMTTDTFLKEFAVQTKLKDGKIAKIGGIAKGSGMISPNMGTMLCFLATDVKASPPQLKNALCKAVDVSFNMTVVDGDESTNDMVLITSDGSSGEIDENFQEALNYVCIELTKMIAKDGEGSTKFMKVQVQGALREDDAKAASKAIVGSSLVKTALFGADPNWGRIIAAVGYSGAEIDEKIISVTMESDKKIVEIVKNGVVKAYEGSAELEIAEDIIKEMEIKIVVDLGLGNYSATAYGCDLSYDYVRINAEYTT